MSYRTHLLGVDRRSPRIPFWPRAVAAAALNTAVDMALLPDLYGPRRNGMGDVLTDWACDSTSYTAAWRTRLNQGLSTGAQAALLGGLAAGLLGGLLKRPILGAAIGGIAGWSAHAIWTAPLNG